ncbi:MAG TPA: nodulation protein NfeD [Thermoanaerobaculaceae bacterium]|nr:nodulation protein NfeD [Thermoanaerobaculaceae bacterium]
MLRRGVATLALLIGLTPCVSAGQRVVILTLSDSIQPASLRYLERGLGVADSSGAAATIIELDTPGGLLTSLRRMTTAITGARRPVVVYVTPAGAQAASAGFFLLMAADVAAMAPGTNAGAAHPVGGEGAELTKTMAEKVTNDAAALVRSLATQRGRSAEWAEKAVRDSASYTEREALEKKLIDVVANDRGELLKWLDGRTIKRFDGRSEKLETSAPEIVVVGPNAGDKLLSVIAHPNIAYLLLLLGLVGIYFELSHPGVILPGVLGGVAILLALFALSVLPVNYVGVLLILLGIGFFVLEVKVASYGLLTVAGLVSFIFGSLMLVRSPFPALRVGLAVVLPTAVGVAFVVMFLLRRVLRSHRKPPITGVEGLVGEVGDVSVAVEPVGKVFVHGEYWEAYASTRIPVGVQIRVVKVDGKRLEVEPAGDLNPRPGE